MSLMAFFRFRDFFQRFLQKQGSIWPRIVCKSYLRWVFILCNASRFEKKCLGAKTLAKTSFFAQNPLFFCSKSAKSAIFTRRFLRKSHSNFFQLSTTCSLRVLVQKCSFKVQNASTSFKDSIVENKEGHKFRSDT